MPNPVMSFRSLVPKFKHRAMRPKPGPKKESVDSFPDQFEFATIKAIEDLITFCNHFIKLTGKTYSKKIGLYNSIEEIIKLMNYILCSIHEKKIIVGSANCDDNEELEMIEDVLDNMWEPNWDDDEHFEFTETLIQFWLKEIRDRGYTIHGLLNGSDDCWNAAAAMKLLEKLNYPPKYGQE